MTEQDYEAFSYLNDVMPVDVTVGGATGWAIIDTGDPWALLDPSTFPSASGLSNGGDIASIAVGGVTVESPYAFGSTAGDDTDYAPFDINANLGCTVVCGYVTSLNYRDVVFSLGATSPPAGLGATTTFDFSLEGGGTIDGVPAPPSRIVVTVSIEGNDYTMILDTGASAVTVSASAFATLTADGRTTATSQAVTTAGMSETTLTRAKTVAVGGVTASGIVVTTDTSFDNNLAAISQTVGRTIDGSLGGTFLHNFYVSIDYASQTVSLSPYADTSFALDPAEAIGITLNAVSATTYQVAAVDAVATAAGVAVGDYVTAIDGNQLASLSPLVIQALLYGKVGTDKEITFGQAGTLTNMTISLPVEEELPLP
jgi:Aspartyl protease